MMLRTRVVSGLKLSLLHRRAGRTGILLIHGNSSCKEVFSKQFPDLARTGLGIVVPDLPGHGASADSPRPSSTYSFPGYARIMGQLMRELGYRSFHVVGWSLGGHIGLEMWARDPDVKSLLISGTPPIHLSSAGVEEGFQWTSATALAGRKRFGADDTRRYVRAMMGRSLPADHHLTKMVQRTDGNARMWMVTNGLAGVGVDERDAVATLDRPLAIVQGNRDPFLRAEYLQRIHFKRLWKQGPVLIDAGHAAHWEAPRAFNTAMADFLTQTN
ncbi:pimeloyl-ACP methyl ester carboxylesterase [Afipia massiliensis]|uniref:Pimeloyl-ACP methyl ester carboxylesterase n=1 Tax=Afipia massiliensis TaxID=211460 RepID=A0A840MY80_9BRAD|nr:alpha/beta hydrolase [Afipia massiliensis]MBB5052795.1 pimeloyl-ACP methyl ester carboxylesterase [Afipia massiliensis]